MRVVHVFIRKAWFLNSLADVSDSHPVTKTEVGTTITESQPKSPAPRVKPFVLVGGLVGIAVLGVPVLVAAWFMGGATQLASAAIIVATVLAYFVIGQVVERLALQQADMSGMLWVMIGYVVRVGLLGGLLWWLLGHPESSAWVSRTWFAVGGAAAVIGWLGGLMWAQVKGRQPVYDKEYEAPKNWQDQT
jgi:hypothetical protein